MGSMCTCAVYVATVISWYESNCKYNIIRIYKDVLHKLICESRRSDIEWFGGE